MEQCPAYRRRARRLPTCGMDYLKKSRGTITATCEMKAKEWDQRSVSRGGEIEAISKALEILTGTVHWLRNF